MQPERITMADTGRGVLRTVWRLPKLIRKHVAYYITPHGFGHAVRSLEVVRLMLEYMPDLEVTIVSDLPEYLIEQCVGKAVPLRRRRLDVGLVQRDSLQFDLSATLAALRDIRRHAGKYIEEETRFLEEGRVAGIVSDIPWLPFHASHRLGIPSLGMSNFTWEWIYESYADSDSDWRDVIEWVREGYRRCGLFLRLPMHGDCSVFPKLRDVPLVARKSDRSRDALRTILGAGSDRKTYLVSFSSLELDSGALARLERMDGRIFFYKRPLDFRSANMFSLNDVAMTYNEIVCAVDGVITKPGYGIVSDCLTCGTPMLYTDRGEFPEYRILVDEMHRRLTAVFIPSPDLRSGAWEEGLKMLEQSPGRFEPMATNGGEICARTILDTIFGKI